MDIKEFFALKQQIIEKTGLLNTRCLTVIKAIEPLIIVDNYFTSVDLSEKIEVGKTELERIIVALDAEILTLNQQLLVLKS